MIVIILDICAGHANQPFIISLLFIINAIVLDVVLVIKDMLKDYLEVVAVDSLFKYSF